MDGSRPNMLKPSKQSFKEIPVIGLADATSKDPAARRALADQIRDACLNVGFFYSQYRLPSPFPVCGGCLNGLTVKDHGIPEKVIETAVGAAKQFFRLPVESKMKLDLQKSANFKGYTALRTEDASREKKGDIHEGFDLGWEPESPANANALRDDGIMTGANLWPDELPVFRKDVLAYYHAVVRLGKSLFPLFALTLNLPEDFFADKITKPAAVMRLLHYPPQPIETTDGGIGIGAHTDYECFTILWQDEVQALQVMNADGKWIDAVPMPGTLVVNLGDQFARWTNDLFKSTIHRAINLTGNERYSMPLFFGTNYDVKLEPIPGCVSAENPFKYEVVTAGQYVQSQLAATYAFGKAKL
ncbi:Clavaminate synthase-like protein [Leucogyrophana mollusca]|uniref:Clavaminate synthase-like protein n=1 Tax=Leucogyrophana mollusca TaxID=85980 RepID=A0ACB8BNP2_9AGAM|nr:Clavaminate synthase-like protein [Leucogyrophana mollusca]